MPQISSLKINNFRNLTDINIAPSPKFNFFFGQNGAGKTSLLESIYYLGVGRSFRTHLPQRLIQETADHFSIFIAINERNQLIPLGVERHREGDRYLKVEGESISNWSALAKRVPLCLLSAMSHRFLLDGPKIRRQFIDWLLFHVEPSFFPVWQRIQHVLKQRNAALKAQLPLDEITYWDKAFIEDAEHVHELREKIISAFNPLFHQILEHLLPEYSLTSHYYRGWPKQNTLAEQLEANLRQDSQRGYTQAGPQRADFRLSIRNLPAQDILSQGQQKLITYALHLAQGLLLKEKTKISPIYLIDDLPAELDADKRNCVINLLSQLKSQVFITGIDPNDLKLPADHSMFHVEHGSIFLSSNKIADVHSETARQSGQKLNQLSALD